MSSTLGRTDRTRHTLNVEASDLRLHYGNMSTGNPVTYAAAIEVDGQVVPFTFGGQARATCADGGFVTTDPINITLPSGVYYLRTYVEVSATGLKVPLGGGEGLVAQVGEGTTVSTGADLTLAGSGPVNIAGVSHAVIPLGAIATTSGPGVAIFGDSISVGALDANPPGYQGMQAGYIVRACDLAGVGRVNHGLGGSTSSDVFDNYTKLVPSEHGLTHALVEHGVNSAPNGNIYGGTKGNLALWKMLAEKGWPVWQTTITPRTTSTDSFTTVEGQSGGTAGTNIANFNAWLRDGAPLIDGNYAAPGTTGALRAGSVGHPLRGIVDVASAIEVDNGRGEMVWNVPNGTVIAPDGLHPNVAGNDLMIPSIRTWAESLTA